MLVLARRSASNSRQNVSSRLSTARPNGEFIPLGSVCLPILSRRYNTDGFLKAITEAEENGVRGRMFRYGNLRNHKDKGKSFQAKTADLKSKRMGGKTKVLIVQASEDDPEPSEFLRSESDPRAVTGSAASSVEDHTDALVPAGAETVELEEALAAIHNLRPQIEPGNESREVSVKVAEKLTETLKRSFTAAQLQAYENRHDAESAEAAASLWLEPLPKAWQWDDHPGTTRETKDWAKSLTKGPKAATISRILERVWRLDIAWEGKESFSASRGITHTTYRLVNAGVPSELDMMAEHYHIKYHFTSKPTVHSSAKLESKQRRLVFTGHQASVLLATRHLEDKLEKWQNVTQIVSIQNAQRRTRYWPRRSSNDAVAITDADLASITRDSGALLTGRFMPNQKVKSSEYQLVVLQALGHQRLLAAKQALTALLQYRSSSAVSISDLYTSTDAAALVEVLSPLPNQSSSLYHKFSRRRIVALASDSTNLYGEVAKHHESIIEQLQSLIGEPVDDAKPLSPYKETAEAEAGGKEADGEKSKGRPAEVWLPDVDQSASINIGHVLHSRPISEASINMSSHEVHKIQQNVSPIDSHFQSFVPNPHLILNQLNLGDGGFLRRRKVKIRLVPDLTLKKEVYKDAPDLELSFALRLHGAGPPQFQSCRALTKHKAHFVMLPNCPVDIALNHSSSHLLNLEATLAPSLQDFVARVSEGLAASQPIDLVPGVTMSMPPFLTNAKKAVDVPYMIANVTQRETLSFKTRIPSQANEADEEVVNRKFPAYYSVHTSGQDGRVSNSMGIHLPVKPWRAGHGVTVTEFKAKQKLAVQEFVKTSLWLVDQLARAQPKSPVKALIKPVKPADTFGIF